MELATAEEIQASVRRFLGGGSAEVIGRLACQSDDNWKPLVESAGVVDKLVDLTLRDKPAGEDYHWAYFALFHLVKLGQVAQDAIAHAHDGAIFKWLAGPQDHGLADLKRELITSFTKDHPANTIRLEVVRSGNAASLVDLVLKNVQSGDNATALLAMNVLVGITRENGISSTLPDSSIDTLVSVLGWDPTNGDSQLSTIRVQSQSLLVQLFHVDETPGRSLLSVADNLKALGSKPSNARIKLVAVLRLNHLTKQNKSSAQEIVSQGGIAAVVAAVRDASVEILPQEAALLLGTLAQESESVRDMILKEGGVASLVLLRRSNIPARKSAAMGALSAFLADESSAKAIAREYGVSLLFEVLQYTKQHPVDQKNDVVKILDDIFDDDENLMSGAALQRVAECDDAVEFLGDLLSGGSNADRGEISKLAEKLGGLIDFILARLSAQLYKHDASLASMLKALEQLSRIPANQSLFQQHEGIRHLVQLLRTSTHPDEVTMIARILANIACKNQDLSKQIVEYGAVEQLITMMNSSDTKTQTAALMSLRNLVSSDPNCQRIGTPAVILRLIEMIREGEAMKQRVVAAAVVGSLARLAANKKRIMDRDGKKALLELLTVVQLPTHIDIVAAALWVLIANDDAVGQIGTQGDVAAIKKAIERHQCSDKII